MRSVELLRQLIRQQTTGIGQPVANLTGPVAATVPVVAVQYDATWQVVWVPIRTALTPSAFYLAAAGGNKVAEQPAVDGALVVGPGTVFSGDVVRSRQATLAVPGTYLIRGQLIVPGRRLLTMNAVAQERNGAFAIYLNGQLLKTGDSDVSLGVMLDPGSHYLEILTSATFFAIELPADQIVSVGELLATPIWESVTTGYLDPAAGTAQVTLAWYNDVRVGGWRILRRQLSALG